MVNIRISCSCKEVVVVVISSDSQTLAAWSVRRVRRLRSSLSDMGERRLVSRLLIVMMMMVVTIIVVMRMVVGIIVVMMIWWSESS